MAYPINQTTSLELCLISRINSKLSDSNYLNVVIEIRKKTNQEYIRSSPDTKSKIRSDLESGQTVKQTFSKNFQSLDHQPRDSKFVENMKYNLEKDQHPGNKKNTADDVQNVMNMISTSHPFLKEIVQTSGKPPDSILYNSQATVLSLFLTLQMWRIFLVASLDT